MVASGGITDIEDVRALCNAETDNIIGAITGRAIYEGTLDLAEGHFATARDRFAVVAMDNPAAAYANDALDLGLAIADVSGHGLPAALQVRDVYMGLRMGLSRDLKVVRTVERLNSIIHQSTLTSRFVTMFYGVVDAATGALSYVLAGHPPPIRIARGAGGLSTLAALANSPGSAILLVSVELDEIMGLSDRIAVMFDGKLMGERLPSETNENELGLLMAGVTEGAA